MHNQTRCPHSVTKTRTCVFSYMNIRLTQLKLLKSKLDCYSSFIFNIRQVMLDVASAYAAAVDGFRVRVVVLLLLFSGEQMENMWTEM